MSVTKDASGRRFVEAQVEVAGTPEEVWRAISTGPGVSSWFVPTAFDERDGKPVLMSSTFGPGMTFSSALTAWEPPHSFTVQAEPWGEMPPIAMEWSVQARAGGGCLVRIVSSLFSTTDDWDDQLESTRTGWPSFFRILQIYLKHFGGQPSELKQFVAPVAGDEAKAWDMLVTALGQKDLKIGEHWTAPAGAPPFSGVSEFLTHDPYDALVRLEEPGPGVVALGAFERGGQAMVAFNIYLYGDKAGETVARDGPAWQAWFNRHFPMPT